MTDYTKTTNFAAKDSLPSGNANKIVKGAEIDTEFTNIATASATKANIASPTFTGTVTIPTADINGGAVDGTTIGATSASSIVGTTIVANTSINIAGDGATVTGIKDEDDMSSNSATKLATQQSIKAYVDSQVTAQDLDVTDGTTSIDIDLDSESLGILGGTGIDSTASGTGVTLAIDSTVATLTGSQTLTNKTLTAPTLTGTAVVASLDISGDVDVDGTLETDALSINGTTVTSTAAELNILDGVTSTAAELNILDGVTSTTAELNILDGVTSTTAELNILDGVTATAAELNIMDGVTATTAELNILDGVTSTAAELNILDGKAFLDEDDMSSNSATGIASQQSIKAYVDAQITAEDLDFQADSGGALSIDLDSETLTFTGGTGIDTSGSGNAVTFAIDSTVATLTGSQTLTNKTLTAPTLTGTAVVASLDISGDIDVDGTTNLDVVDIDGAVDMASTLQVDGAITSSSGATITVADNTDNLSLISTDTDDNSGPNLRMYRFSANPADADVIGQIDFEGRNDNTQDVRYGFISAKISDASDGSEDGQLRFFTIAGGTETQTMTLESGNSTFAGNVTADGSVTITGSNEKFVSNSTSSGDYVRLYAASGTGKWDIYGNGANLRIGDNDSAGAVVIDTNVGIGVTPNASTNTYTHFQVARKGSGILSFANSHDIKLTGNAYYNSGWKYANAEQAAMYEQTLGKHTFFYAPSGTADSAITWATAMTIDNSGNVGIGTSSPAHDLDVLTSTASTSKSMRLGATASTGANNATMIISNGGTGDAMLRFDYEGTNTDRARIGVSSSAQQLEFYTAGDNERMRIDSSGNVGIGTSGAPSFNTGSGLEIQRAGPATLRIEDTGSGGKPFEIYSDDAEGYVLNGRGSGMPMYFKTVNQLAMTIDTNQNVGIGTSDAKEKLSVSGAAVFDGDHATGTNAYGAAQGVMIHAASSTGFITAVSNGANDVDLQLRALNGGSANSNQLVLDSEGNVGIGTSSLASGDKLTVAGRTKINSLYLGEVSANYDLIQSTSSAGLRLISTGGSVYLDSNGDLIKSGGVIKGERGTEAAPAYSFSDDTDTGMFNISNAHLGFSVGGTERVRINSNGNVFVGKTDFGVTTAGCAIADNGTSQFITSGNDNTPMAIGSEDDTTLTLVNFHGASATAGGSISISGGTSVAYNTSSDQRLKENITDADDAGELIDAIQVRQFDWKVDGSHQRFGMVAQELTTVAPEAVSTPEDPDEIMGVDYSKLVPMLIKEIQSLRARVQQLENN